ncbi:MAG TPA: Ig-like domain-containing protein [Polyangiaceae bacterium]|nr:Ig-like domain-containing protein [Polyangiaceae bacterium]
MSSAEAGEVGRGGSAGADADIALTLLRSTPAPDAENASFHDPIELVFSRPLDRKTVNGSSVTLEIGGNAIAATVTSSADRSTVLVRVNAPPIMPSAVTIHVDGSACGA